MKHLFFTSMDFINDDTLSLISTNIPALVSLTFVGMLGLSVGLVEIVKSCRALQTLKISNISDTFILTRSDVEAIASLPRLKLLVILGIDMEEGAVSALNRCGSLRVLALGGNYDKASVRAVIDTNIDLSVSIPRPPS